MRKIVSFLLIAVFLIVPVSATSFSSSDVEYIQKSSFWNWLAGKPGTDWNKFVGYTFGNSCPNSEDGYHHASSYQRPEASWGGPTGYYKCICDLCGAEFTAYESDLQQSYEAQVEELPAPVYGADGSIYVIPDLAVFHKDESSYCWTMSNGETKENSVYRISVSLPLIRYEILQNLYEKQETCRYGVRLSYTVPFLCSAEVLYSSAICTSSLTESVLTLDSSVVQNCVAGSDFRVEFLSGYLTMVKSENGRYVLQGNYVNFYLNDLRLKLTPYDTGTTTGTTYNINSRPTSITGDYGIIGDNGQIIKVEGDKIVNETNNYYYNPATGETTTITDWSYNYEDRSYTVTTESGDTVTITYGDENVVIKEGDTIYNVYYLVGSSGSENPDPGPGPEVCDHTWTETSRTEPTCTTAGKVTSSCSKCSQTKTETIPATGHTWVVDRTVQTTYDEEGNLLQQGYTIYSCSVCGEQYKDMEGTGPPGPEEEKSIWEKIGDFFGTIGGGFIDIIDAIAGKLLDALIALAEMMMEKFKTIVETILSIFDEVPALFGGFLDFLAAIFPFLPPEITTILTFGVIAITFIGILKAVRR